MEATSTVKEKKGSDDIAAHWTKKIDPAVVRRSSPFKRQGMVTENYNNKSKREWL